MESEDSDFDELELSELRDKEDEIYIRKCSRRQKRVAKTLIAEAKMRAKNRYQIVLSETLKKERINNIAMKMFANPDLKKEDHENWDRLSTESDYANARELVKSGKVTPPMPFTHKFHKFPTALTNICFQCKQYGHFARDCTNKKSPIQLCFHCGVPGHARPDCDKLKAGKFTLDLFLYKRTHD